MEPCLIVYVLCSESTSCYSSPLSSCRADQQFRRDWNYSLVVVSYPPHAGGEMMSIFRVGAGLESTFNPWKNIVGIQCIIFGYSRHSPVFRYVFVPPFLSRHVAMLYVVRSYTLCRVAGESKLITALLSLWITRCRRQAFALHGHVNTGGFKLLDAVQRFLRPRKGVCDLMWYPFFAREHESWDSCFQPPTQAFIHHVHPVVLLQLGLVSCDVLQAETHSFPHLRFDIQRRVGSQNPARNSRYLPCSFLNTNQPQLSLFLRGNWVRGRKIWKFVKGESGQGSFAHRCRSIESSCWG